MIEVKAPHDYSAHKGKKSIFLAGSIEMGAAVDWQKAVVEALAGEDILILNPRRGNWDPSWEQSIANPKFREQVEWELSALEAAKKIVFYFAPGTKSPVTMAEFGFHAAKNPEKMIVCCPEGFWRKGNIDIMCARYGVAQADTLESLISAVSTSFLKKTG